MANKLVKMSFVDVNNLKATMDLIFDEADITSCTEAIQAASNAATVDIDVTTPVNLALVTGNNPVQANVETVRSRLVISCRGADLGNLVRPFDECEWSIPAWDGSLYPYNVAVPLAAKILAIVNRAKSKSGVQMSTVKGVKVARS